MRVGLRPTLRTLRYSARRLNSSSPSSSSSSSSVTSNQTVQKGIETAQKYASQGAAALSKVAGPVGARVSGTLGSWQEPIIFNFKTFTSLCRQVYKAEKLSFPTDLHTWTSAYSHIWARATNGGWWKETMNSGAYVGLGVVAAEVYGIFCLGEMIGRRHLVGYKLKDH